MKVKRILSVILIMSIIVTNFSSLVQISAQTEESAFNKAAQVIAAEDESVQTASRPAETTYEFVISGEDDFASFMTTSELWESKYKIILSCDIDMKGKVFNPIKEFDGVFDGCGHTVSNLKIQNNVVRGKNIELALINTLNECAEIKNVIFDNYTIDGKSILTKTDKAAGLIVTNHGTISSVDIINGSINNIDEKANASGYVIKNEEDGIIENCFVGMNNKDANIKSGFVLINTGKITKCSTKLSVNSKDIAGGFCGSNLGEISYCKSEGTVKASVNNGVTICGGFVVENSGIIKDSSSTGKVEGQEFTGGFAGINSDKGEIISSKATCDVKSYTSYIMSINCGGFVGLNVGKMLGCSFDGKVDGYSLFNNAKTTFKDIGISYGSLFGVIFGSSIVINIFRKIAENFQHTGSRTLNKFSIIISLFFSVFIVLSIFALIIIPLVVAVLISIKLTKKINNYVLVGGFCGNNLGEISGSRSEGNVTANAKTVKTKCGGFIGGNDKQGKISSCISTGSVEGQEYVGGFCGDNKGEISKSNSSCNAKASTKVNTNRCGGFVGENSGAVSDSTSTGSATGEEYVGGFAGVNKSEIIDCNADGKATAKTKTHTALAGGFVGENEKGTIISCTATGGADSRSSSGQAKAGGFVGINKASIMSSKASGKVYLSAGTFRTDDGCGGFVGKNDQGGSIDGCYAEAMVETTNKKKGGGFVGEAKSKSTIKNSQSKAKIVTKSGTKSNTKFCENKDKKAVIAN